MRNRGLIAGLVLGAVGFYYLDRRGLRRQGARRTRWSDFAPRRYGARVGDLGGLEAANLATPEYSVALLGVAGALGALLALYGLSRSGIIGLGARAVGTGLVMTNLRERRPVAGAGERRRIVDIQKTLRIEAPVDRVYRTIAAADGLPVQWEAVITMDKPGELLAWRSRPGSALESAGAVRFSREGSGTRLDLRFCYNPSGGGVEAPDLFGADPRSQLNEDLGRLKALLESEARSEARWKYNPDRAR